MGRQISRWLISPGSFEGRGRGRGEAKKYRRLRTSAKKLGGRR